MLLTDGVQPIKLPRIAYQYSTYEDQIATFAAWGDTALSKHF